jgi:DNA-binding transcriptional LysR family regulator
VIRRICTDEIRLWVSEDGSYRTQDLAGDGAVLVYDPAIFGLTHPLGPRGGANFARTVITSNFHVVANLAAAGVGIGVLPERVARLLGTKLRPLPRELLHVPHEISLIYRPDAQRSPASRQFARELEELLLKSVGSKSSKSRD